MSCLKVRSELSGANCPGDELSGYPTICGGVLNHISPNYNENQEIRASEMQENFRFQILTLLVILYY